MELNANENLLRNTIDSSMDLIQVLKTVRNEEGKIIDFIWILNNKTSEKSYGDIIGKSLLNLSPGIFEEGIFDTLKEVVQTGELNQCVQYYEHEQFDGWYLRSAVKQDDGVAITIKDISTIQPTKEQIRTTNAFTWAAIDAARATEALQKSEKRFQSIVNLVPDLLWESRPDGSTNWYNDRWMEYTGQHLEDAIGWGWVDALHTDDREASARKYAAAAISGILLQQEHRIRRYDGEYRWFAVSALPIKDETGKVVKIYGAATDIHDRKQAEEGLRKSEHRLQQAFSIPTVGVIYFDSEGVIHDANEAFCRISGYTKENLKAGKVRWDEVTPEEFIHVTLTARQELLTIGENTPYQKQYIRPDGSRWWGLFAGKRVNENEYVGFIVDVSTQKRYEDELRQFTAELEKTIEKRTHELRDSRDQLRSILDTTLVQMSIMDAVRDEHGHITDMQIKAVNKELEKATGRSDLVGKLYAQEYPGIKKNGLFQLIVKTIETGEPQTMEYFYAHEGFNKWFSSMFVKLNDGVVSSNQDVSARKQAEEERLKNYVLLQQSEDLADLGSWDYNLLNKKFIWSDGMYRLFNIEKGKEIQPEIYLEFTTERGREAAERVVCQIKTGKSTFEETLEISVSGKRKILRLKAAAVFDKEGRVERVLGVDMDISPMQAAEAKIRQMEAQQHIEIFRTTLRTQEEERRRISESLHNGIGQVLYGVKMSLSQLSTYAALNNTAEFESAHRYTSDLLLSAIKDVRKISHELMPAVLEEFGLVVAIKDVCDQMQDGVMFRCMVDLDHLALDKFMQLAVFRTVQELMTNVVKHAQAKEAVVDVRLDKENIIILVSDNGVGFDQQVSKRNGIGLLSIKSKIDLLKGTVNIKSTLGEGTKVKVQIPFKEERL